MIDFELHLPTVAVCIVLELVGAYIYGFMSGLINEWKKGGKK